MSALFAVAVDVNNLKGWMVPTRLGVNDFGWFAVNKSGLLNDKSDFVINARDLGRDILFSQGLGCPDS